mmetsp:Transcript_76823/g.150567  ORF Transcript_76823/g.150567 Transcript_76823/m.150567 type:complete len:93 (+) Transcript_76823:77-355(+)
MDAMIAGDSPLIVQCVHKIPDPVTSRIVMSLDKDATQALKVFAPVLDSIAFAIRVLTVSTSFLFLAWGVSFFIRPPFLFKTPLQSKKNTNDT